MAMPLQIVTDLQDDRRQLRSLLTNEWQADKRQSLIKQIQQIDTELSVLSMHPADDQHLVDIRLLALCRQCNHQHNISTNPRSYLQEIADWNWKHRFCDQTGVEVISVGRELPAGFDDRLMEKHGRGPWWLTAKHNANIKLVYAASAAPTFTLASLATSSTLLAGRSSAVVDNTTNLYMDYMAGGKITTGTSPSAATIEPWIWGVLNDTPLYPDAITGSDANVSATTRDILAASHRLVSVMVTTATNNQGYYFAPVSVASLFGGVQPLKWGFWVVHNTGVNLNSTGGNHVVSQTGIYATAT